MASDRKYAIVVFVTAVLVRLLFHVLSGLIYDDAFITFRYAQNIADGHGFVYNVGERVLGTTTPLFTLILAALACFGISIVKGALAVSLLSSGLTAVILYRFAQSLGFAHFSLLPVSLYVFFPRLLSTDTGGMETSLFALLVTSAFYFQHKRLFVYSIAAAAVAVTTRPEGLLALGILIVFNSIKDHKRAVVFLALATFIILPWVVFAYFYFGSPIPNSIPAKLALYSLIETNSYGENLVFLMGWHHPFGVPLLVLVVVGALWLRKKRGFGWLEILWMTSMVVSLTISSTFLFLWYITPIYPLYLLFAGATFPLICSWSKWFHQRINTMAKLSVIGTILVLGAASYSTSYSNRSYQTTVETVHWPIGRYLQTHARPGDVAAMEDIGYMGYYSGIRIIDRDGLISPEVISYNRSGDYLGVILDYKPHWVVACTQSPISTFLDSSFFTEHYQLREMYVSPSSGREYKVLINKARTSTYDIR